VNASATDDDFRPPVSVIHYESTRLSDSLIIF